MLSFTLFNIPIRVEPWFWLTAFLIGGGIGVEDQTTLLHALLWIIVIFISIIVHELGHALTSRKLTGSQPQIKLWAMGGLAYPNTSLSRKQSFWVTLAGPLAGLSLFLGVVVACFILYGAAGGGIVHLIVTGNQKIDLATAQALSTMPRPGFVLLNALIFVNLWWSLLNLLPVYPLDGGQIYASIERSEKRVMQVGLVTGIAVAAIAFLVFGRPFAALIFGFLAYQNYQRLQMLSGR